MKMLHCPNCGTPFVRVTYQEGMMGRVLNQLNVFPFRCQLCMNMFRTFHRQAGQSSQAFDRRQYKRLPTSIEAEFLADNRFFWIPGRILLAAVFSLCNHLLPLVAEE